MSHYQGPRFKKIRHFGALPGLTSKKPRSASDLRNQSRSRKRSQYRIHLEEKQKLHFHYGLTERQLLRYVRIARKANGSNMQRQAVLLSQSKKCIVGTGLERQVALNSGGSAIAECEGKIIYTNAEKIILLGNGDTISISLVMY